MRVLSHPLRFDADGSLATVEDGSPRHAGELAGIVAMTGMGERSLAPEYGVPDDLDVAQIAAAISRCESDLDVQDVSASIDAGLVGARIIVEWME